MVMRMTSLTVTTVRRVANRKTTRAVKAHCLSDHPRSERGITQRRPPQSLPARLPTTSRGLPGEDVTQAGDAYDRIKRGEMVRAFIVSKEYRERFGKP